MPVTTSRRGRRRAARSACGQVGVRGVVHRAAHRLEHRRHEVGEPRAADRRGGLLEGRLHGGERQRLVDVDHAAGGVAAGVDRGEQAAEAVPDHQRLAVEGLVLQRRPDVVGQVVAGAVGRGTVPPQVDPHDRGLLGERGHDRRPEGAVLGDAVDQQERRAAPLDRDGQRDDGGRGAHGGAS
jgi:hypothetical protein